MFGHLSSKTNTGFPYAGENRVEFSADEIARVGKLTAFGSATVQFVVELKAGGELVHVRACDQSKDDERFLRRAGKRIGSVSRPPRIVGWRIEWTEVN